MPILLAATVGMSLSSLASCALRSLACLRAATCTGDEGVSAVAAIAACTPSSSFAASALVSSLAWTSDPPRSRVTVVSADGNPREVLAEARFQLSQPSGGIVLVVKVPQDHEEVRVLAAHEIENRARRRAQALVTEERNLESGFRSDSPVEARVGPGASGAAIAGGGSAGSRRCPTGPPRRDSAIARSPRVTGIARAARIA